MNRLNCVNQILEMNGVLEVPALDTGGPSHAGRAEKLMDNISLEVQARGWHFNTFHDVQFSPNMSKHINVPNGIIQIDTCGRSEHIDVVVLEGKLYNKSHNTFEFDGPIYVHYVVRYKVECTPYEIRQLIVDKAAFEFHNRYQRFLDGVGRTQMLYNRVLESTTRAHQWDSEKADVSILETRENLNVLGDRWRELIYA